MQIGTITFIVCAIMQYDMILKQFSSVAISKNIIVKDQFHNKYKSHIRQIHFYLKIFRTFKYFFCFMWMDEKVKIRLFRQKEDKFWSIFSKKSAFRPRSDQADLLGSTELGDGL